MNFLLVCSTVLLLSLSVSAFYSPPPYVGATSGVPSPSTSDSFYTSGPTSGHIPAEGSTTEAAKEYTSGIEYATTAAPIRAETTEATDNATTVAEPTPTVSESQEPKIYSFNGSLYQFGSALDSVEAEDYCKDLGGLWNLASIHSAQENDFLLAQLEVEFQGATGAWVGGLRAEGEVSMTWVDGKPWYFENWAEQQPQEDGECLKMALNEEGKWRVANCAETADAVVCKLSPISK